MGKQEDINAAVCTLIERDPKTAYAFFGFNAGMQVDLYPVDKDFMDRLGLISGSTQRTTNTSLPYSPAMIDFTPPSTNRQPHAETWEAFDLMKKRRVEGFPYITEANLILSGLEHLLERERPKEMVSYYGAPLTAEQLLEIKNATLKSAENRSHELADR